MSNYECSLCDQPPILAVPGPRYGEKDASKLELVRFCDEHAAEACVKYAKWQRERGVVKR